MYQNTDGDHLQEYRYPGDSLSIRTFNSEKNLFIMHFCVLQWPSWLGRQTHRVFVQIQAPSSEISGGRGFGSRLQHLYSGYNAPGICPPIFLTRSCARQTMASRLTTEAPTGNTILQFHSIKGDRVQQCMENGVVFRSIGSGLSLIRLVTLFCGEDMPAK